MNKRLISETAAGVAAATALAVAFVNFWPDVRRYLRIRRM
ncbi:DUF6893 family small protein [Streptomyces sp. NPDC048182]